jgi:hypothetical protein
MILIEIAIIEKEVGKKHNDRFIAYSDLQVRES